MLAWGNSLMVRAGQSSLVGSCGAGRAGPGSGSEGLAGAGNSQRALWGWLQIRNLVR